MMQSVIFVSPETMRVTLELPVRGKITGMVVPNVFGPFGKPNYNSFIATFGYKLTHGDSPTVLQDNEVNLIYVGSLCRHICD